MIRVFYYYFLAKCFGNYRAGVMLEELSFSRNENTSMAAKMCLVKLGLRPEDWNGED